MNLKEYLNQNKIEPQSKCSVDLKQRHVTVHHSKIIKGIVITAITIKAFKKHLYCVIGLNGMIYTMDKKGFPDKTTVFNLKK